MVSLKIKDRTAVVVEAGAVDVTANCVVLYEFNGPRVAKELVTAYCMYPGETVRRTEEGEYLVEF